MNMRRRNKRFIVSPQDTCHSTEELVTIALLAAQAGHRMKSYGPTPLLQLGNQTLLDKQISVIRSVFKNFELIVCVGFGSEKVIKYIKEHYSDINIRVVENQVHHHSNCCESARLCLNNTTNGKILICNGDLVLERNVFDDLLFNHSYVMAEKNPSKNLEVGLTMNQHCYIENLCFGLEKVWSEIAFIHSIHCIKIPRCSRNSRDYCS